MAREDMSAHAAVCERLREKRFPVCDGYCCRRNPLANDDLIKRPSVQHWAQLARRHKRGARPATADAKGARHIPRTSWMMMEPVDVHWVPTNSSQPGLKCMPPACGSNAKPGQPNRPASPASPAGASCRRRWFPSVPDGLPGRVGPCISCDPPAHLASLKKSASSTSAGGWRAPESPTGSATGRRTPAPE